MEKIKIWNDNPSEKQIEEICRYIEDSGLVIIPTDTIYAITCNALDTKAIERLCRLKNINPEKTNLSIICDGIAMASEYARIDNTAFRILKDNVPGPFTFLFKTGSSLPRAFKGRKIVGIRIPANELCLSVVRHLGFPLLTTSIDFQDKDYGHNPELIEEYYSGKVDLMVAGEDGGLVPSTIVDLTSGEPVIEREGKGILK